MRYTQLGGAATVRKLFGPVLVQAGGRFDTYRYRDVRIGNARLDQTYRNHDSSSIEGRIGYRFGPGLLAFAQGTHRRERYDRRDTADLLNSNEITVLGGVRFAITRLVSGEAGIGYIRRRYLTRRFGPTRGLAYDGSIIWNPTTLLTVTARARKTIDESPTLLASGVLSDAVSAEFDYELFRNLLVNARGAWTSERYQDVDRHDRRIEARVGARYLLNRFAEVGLQYQYGRQRGAGALGRSYRGNELHLTFTVQR